MASSVGARQQDFDDPPKDSEDESPKEKELDRSVIRDATYRVTSVDYVSPTVLAPVRSLFDDSTESIETTWRQARRLGDDIASATDDQAEGWAEKAQEKAENMEASAGGASTS